MKLTTEVQRAADAERRPVASPIQAPGADVEGPRPSGPGRTIDHPPHYAYSDHEPIDVIEAWQLGFCLGNTVKYIARAGRKGDALEDLRKARWYLDREITRREAGDA